MLCLRNFIPFKNSKSIKVLSIVIKGNYPTSEHFNWERKKSFLEGTVFKKLIKWH